MSVVAFADFAAEAFDWTAAERAQLREVSRQLAAHGGDLDLVFGKSDDDEPWCAIADASGEVVLHVARIDGRFMVHSSETSRLVESHDLWGALKSVLGGTIQDRRGVVLPFSQDAIAVLALWLVAALRGELDHLGAMTLESARSLASETLDEPAPIQEEAEPPSADSGSPAPETPGAGAPPTNVQAADPAQPQAVQAVRAEGAAARTDPQPAQPAPAAAPAPTNAAPEAPRQDAPPKAPSKPAPPPETRQTKVAEGGTTSGGDGPEVFVVNAPAAFGPPSPTAGAGASAGTASGGDQRLLGVLNGFNAGEGDRIEVQGGVLLSQVRLDASAGGFVRLGYDFNGDGVEDGYVLLAPAGAAAAPTRPTPGVSGPASAGPGGEAPPVGLSGGVSASAEPGIVGY